MNKMCSKSDTALSSEDYQNINSHIMNITSQNVLKMCSKTQMVSRPNLPWVAPTCPNFPQVDISRLWVNIEFNSKLTSVSKK